MRTLSVNFFSSLFVMLFLWGCSSAPKIDKSHEASKPELSLRVGSLNMSNLNKRVERSDIIRFARLLKQEQIDVLTIQNISRYPGVTTRTDIVDELSSQTDWRNVFGEMSNTGGHQVGNAIFSLYPVISHINQPFESVNSSSFESALQATIDAGVQSINIISTQLPTNANEHEVSRCVKLIASLNPEDSKTLVIVAGNLPHSEEIRTIGSFVDVSSTQKETTPQLWKKENSQLKATDVHYLTTGLGTLVIARFDVFRQK